MQAADTCSPFNSFPSIGQTSDTFQTVGVLYNTSHALNVSQLLPPGGSAWVDLRTVNGSGVWQWAWNNTASPSLLVDYGLHDPSAWVAGAIPQATEGLCAKLTSTGKLESLPCSQFLNASHSACAIDLCKCEDDLDCTPLAFLSRTWQGFTCMREEQQITIEAAHVFNGLTEVDPLTGTLANGFEIGCGTPFGTAEQAETGLAALPLAPGDTLRVCGDTGTEWPNLEIMLAFAGAGTIRGQNCLNTPLNDTARCQQYGVDGRLAVVNRPPPTISAGLTHTCAILRFPIGAVRCWGTDQFLPSRPPGEPVAARSVSTGRDGSCIVRASDGKVLCWGSRFIPLRGVPSLIENVYMVDAGTIHACLILQEDGRVRCWNTLGDAEVPAALPAALDISTYSGLTCILTTTARAVWCWSFNQPKTSLKRVHMPPAQQISAGTAHVCAILTGTGEVRCESLSDALNGAAANIPPGLPPAVQIGTGEDSICVLLITGRVVCWGAPEMAAPVDLPLASSIAVGRGHACAILADSGSVRCWGAENNAGQQNVPPGLGPVASAGDVVLGRLTSFRPGALPLGIAATALMTIKPLVWEIGQNADRIVSVRAPANSSDSFSRQPVLTWHAGYMADIPQIELYVQGADGPQVTYCSSLDVQSAYRIECTGPERVVYGLRSLGWNGTSVLEQIAKRPGRVHLNSVEPADQKLIFTPFDSKTVVKSLSERLSAATLSPVSVTQSRIQFVRAGDVIALRGEGFGLSAGLQSVPWWNRTQQGLLRSCIHMSWWVSASSYHNSSSCICNGREDWLGEGELPLSNIKTWNDTDIQVVIPVGEGIREVRVCVEGKSQLELPRSNASYFLVYEPPALVDILPARFSDSTDTDTPISLVIRAFAKRGSPPLSSTWGRCDVASLSLVWNDTNGRWDYALPLPSEVAGAMAQHCTALALVQDTILDCYVSAGTQNASALWASLGVRLSSQLQSCTASLSPAADTDEFLVVEAGVDGSARSFALPLPSPVPNAILNIGYTASAWDAGVEIRRLDEVDARVTFTRPEPEIRAITPNPLLLGPVGGIGTPPALLTFFGIGFRTPEEIVHPPNGLLAYESQSKVWIDGVLCKNMTIVRGSGGLATATCVFPSDELAGGTHYITFESLGSRSIIPSPLDNTLVALTTSCAPGFYGLASSELGPTTCRPCPSGGVCLGGIAEAPVADWGFYNLGQPPGSEARVALMRSVQWLNASCPPGKADGGRTYACILPCDPPEACIGANLCAPGYVSVPPEYRCARCDGGYYRTSGVCTLCPVIGVPGLLLLIVVMLLLGAAAYILSSHSIRLCTLNIVLEYAQVVSLLSRPNLPWPGAIKRMLQALSILRVNIEVSAPECYTAIDVTPEMKLWIVLVLPVIAVLVALALYLALGLAKRVLVRQYSHGLGETIGGSNHDNADKEQGGKVAIWSHGPVICRAALKLLAALYLPVVQTSLEVWNCTPTDPPDGFDYLSIVFEPCNVPGGLQQRMVPWAVAGLLLYGALYPTVLGVFYWRYSDLIEEDQLLRACGVGEDRRTNPVAYDLRKYFAPLYEDYRPGYHQAALLALARKSLVCIAALMLTKSPIMVAAAVSFVVTISVTAHTMLQPLMTPGSGFAIALAQFEGRVATKQGKKTGTLHAHLAEIAARTHVPILDDLAAGRMPSSDIEAALRPWWAPAVDWNHLESELQLQVVLTGLLSILYNAAQNSVYAERASGGITAAFFVLIFVATAHISVTVAYDMFLQLRDAFRQLLDLRDARREAKAATKADIEVSLALESGALTPGKALYIFCCRWRLTRSKARSLLVESKSVPGRQHPLARSASMKMSAWIANPLDQSRAARAELLAGNRRTEHAVVEPSFEPACLPSVGPGRNPRDLMLSRAAHCSGGSAAATIQERQGSEPHESCLSPRGISGQNPLLQARAPVPSPAAFSLSPIGTDTSTMATGSTTARTGGTSENVDSRPTLSSTGDSADPADTPTLEQVLAALDRRTVGNDDWLRMRSTFISVWNELASSSGARI